jgi:hypothetical protein
METWVCVRCGETKVIDRHAKDQEKVPFTIGGAKPKAEPDDPAPGMEDLDS